MNLEVIILAAGPGKRMKSPLPKVLHPLGGKPLLRHVLECALALQPARCHVVVGRESAQIRESLQDMEVNWVEQAEPLGTAHAVLQALPAVGEDARVLVLFGDVPLVTPENLNRLLAEPADAPALLTAEVGDPTGYGRVLRDEGERFLQVVEDLDADDQQRRVKEINTGMMTAPAAWLKESLPQVDKRNAQGEYYLPDALSLAVAQGVSVATVCAASEIEVLGVNDRVQLHRAEREYQHRKALELLRNGTGVADAHRLDIRGELQCGEDVSLDVNVLLEGRVSLGSGVQVGANCVLIDCDIGPGTEIKPFSHLEGVSTGADCTVGPCARLRPETVLGDRVRIGNFVEVKKSCIGAGSKVNHLSYIGDSELGEDVNIGAGTITCNYDGANKHRTRIGDRVFVGSNSTLVAPLSIEDDSFVGAGSVITKAVDREQLAVARTRQRNLDGWKRPAKKDG